MKSATVPAAWTAWLALVLLAGCERGADSGATANPVAPGRPGTGNPVVEVAPTPGSPTQSPQVGGARGQVPQGITGSGGPTVYPGRSQGAAPSDPGAVPGGLDSRRESASGAAGRNAPPADSAQR